MPEVIAPLTHHDVPGVGRVPFPNREMMKRKGERRMFARLDKLHPLFEEIPAPPATCDWSHGETIKFPILGNGTVGDCYLAALLHMVQLFLGQYGAVPQWLEDAVIARYYELSGGDNGLSDSDVYPVWKKGILEPNGPHKIRDSLIVDTLNPETLKLAIWGMCGVLYTCSLPSGWANATAPGSVWGTGGGGSVGGHAIILSGYKANGMFDLRTWGISPPIQVTLPGMLENDPEVIVVFSEEMFHPVTRLSPAGFTWEQTRTIWIQHGGADVGPAPWVDPVPVPPSPPTPVPPDPTPTPVPVPPAPTPTPPPVVIPPQGVVAGGTVTIPGQWVQFGFRSVYIPEQTVAVNVQGQTTGNVQHRAPMGGLDPAVINLLIQALLAWLASRGK